MANKRTLDRLPPVLSMLLTEGANLGKRMKLRRDKGFLREVREQAAWSTTNWRWADQEQQARPGEYVVTPSLAANPLSQHLKCGSKRCRVRNANDFGRFVALYTDGVVIPDHITGALSFEDDNNAAVVVQEDLPLVEELVPLAEAGILRFASPPPREFCVHCANKLHPGPTELASQLIQEARDSIQLDWFVEDDGSVAMSVACPYLLTTPGECVFLELDLNEEQKTKLRAIHAASPNTEDTLEDVLPIVETDVQLIVEQVMHRLARQIEIANKTGATVLTGCRAESLALATDGGRMTASAMTAREDERRIALPWFERLTLAEAIQLREQCRESLTSLRGRLAKAPTDGSNQTIRDLRAEVLQVQRELTPRRGRFVQDVGMVTAVVALVIGSSISLPIESALIAMALALPRLRGDADGEDRRVKEVKARPAYSLLESDRIVQERGEH